MLKASVVRLPVLPALLAALLVAGLAGSVLAADKAMKVELKLEPQAAAKLPYMPVRVPLSETKPEGITKEPQYQGTPKYATLHLGDGKKTAFFLALDEPTAGDWKIYVDVNQNGDLTDDGDGAWSGKQVGTGRTMFGVNHYVFHPEWKSAKKHSDDAGYGIGIYRFTNLADLLLYREGGRTGTVMVDGKSHAAILAENDADGLFNKPALTPEDARKGRPVWLAIDLNDDGKFDFRSGAEFVDVRAPFKLGEKTYEAKVAGDGSRLELRPTTKVAVDTTPRAPARPALLTAGTAAPDFTAQKWGGGDLKLSQDKGQVVILDFWATWCGPCQASMPHLEKVYQAVKDQNVAVVGVCVWDEKKAYEDWVPANHEKYHFTLAYDPAGRADSNIAAAMYKVSGIPTTYVIDKEGKVVNAIVGYEPSSHELEDTLKKLGVKLPEGAQASAR